MKRPLLENIKKAKVVVKGPTLAERIKDSFDEKLKKTVVWEEDLPYLGEGEIHLLKDLDVSTVEDFLDIDLANMLPNLDRETFNLVSLQKVQVMIAKLKRKIKKKKKDKASYEGKVPPYKKGDDGYEYLIILKNFIEGKGISLDVPWTKVLLEGLANRKFRMIVEQELNQLELDNDIEKDMDKVVPIIDPSYEEMNVFSTWSSFKMKPSETLNLCTRRYLWLVRKLPPWWNKW